MILMGASAIPLLFMVWASGLFCPSIFQENLCCRLFCAEVVGGVSLEGGWAWLSNGLYCIAGNADHLANWPV